MSICLKLTVIVTSFFSYQDFINFLSVLINDFKGVVINNNCITDVRNFMGLMNNLGSRIPYGP